MEKEVKNRINKSSASVDTHIYTSKEEILAAQFKQYGTLDTKDVEEDDPETILDYKLPSATYTSKKEYLEAHFDYFYTWICENFDTKDIEEDEIKKIVESATLEQLDIHTNEEPFEVYQPDENCDIFELYILIDIEDRLDTYFDSKKNSY